MILIILLGLIKAQDLCKEYLSFESCIKNTHTTCMWDEERESCFYTSNYLLGCSPYLNKPACLKQLGPSAICRFSNRCEYIHDLTTEVCSNSLSKYGCLSIKNPDAICEWNGQCNYVTNISEIQEMFGEKMYSQSACSRINHFMIMHNIILWQVTNYKPDLILEADNQYRREIGLEVNDSKSYNMTGNPQNFFIDTNDQLRLYVLSKTKEVAASDLKISDRTREGCIAIEIQSDKDFIQLLSKNPIYGVNNVYCHQLYETSLKITTAFYNNRCIDIDLKNIPPLPCKSLSYRLCGYYYNKKQPCQIVYKTDEFYQSETSCIDTQTQSGEDKSCDQKLSTFNDCRQSSICYLDLSGSQPQCNNQCFYYYDFKTCKSPCIWEDLTYLASQKPEGQQVQSDGDFNGQAKLCVPPLKCDQPGLSKSMCQKLPYACKWDLDYMICESIPKIKLKYMKCSEANTLFTCTMIETSNQACLWDGDQCVNVYELSILDQLSSNSLRVSLNLNLCKKSKENFKFDWALRVCNYYRTSAKTYEANKVVCFQDSAVPNHYWDDFSEQCLSQTQYPKQSLDCSSLKQVNYQFCILYGVPSSSDKLCLYDTSISSCYEIERAEINCQTPGIDADMCLSNNFYCRISDAQGSCQIISTNEINQYNCKELTKVTRLVCVSFIGTLEEPCFYDTIQQTCYVDNVPKSYCNDKMNAFACQTASIKCYFKDLKCQELKTNDYLDWGCNQNFMSKSLCLSLDKPCQWNNNKCQDVDIVLSDCQQYQDQTTIKGCAALKTFDAKLLETFNYCQVNDQNKCVQNTEAIADCGTDLIINSHRCIGFTQGFCYFDNFVCKQLDFTQRISQIILNTLNCNQGNLQTCTKITTEGQNCLVVDDDLSMYIKNKRCVNYNKQLSCTELAALSINQNTCINSNQACIYEDKCKDIDQNFQYSCNSKISQIACQSNTIGLCVFDGKCKIFDYQNYQCKNHNQFACQQSQTQCVFRDGTCQLDLNETSDISNTDLIYYSWARCSNFYSYSYGYRDKCARDQIDDLPCQIKGSSYSACISSKQFCLNLRGQCVDYFEMKCEEAQSQNECVDIQTLGQNCVFNELQNLCFNQDDSIPCSVYKFTNLNYCLQYPNCVYHKFGDNYCIDQTIFIQYNTIAQETKCEKYTVYLDECVQQFTDTCVYNYDYWSCDYYSDFTKCPDITQDIYSKQVCLHAGCKFQITQQGGFCYQDTLTCEVLSSFLCIRAFDLNLKCAVVNDACQTWTQQECDSVTLMNYFACQLAPDCVYDQNNNVCKPKRHKVQDCTIYTNEISCLLTAQNKCKYESDQCVSQDTFEATINRFGCLNLDGYYFYDEDLLECVEITDSQYSCRDLTQQACLELTKDVQCAWQDKCQQVSDLNLQKITHCEILNKDSCIQIENSAIICKWNNQCHQEATTNDGCTTISTIDNYSKSICAIALNKCLYNFSECQVILNDQFNQCEGLGLSQKACLENTSLTFCKWIGYCVTANLYSTICDEVVSQKTCESILTLGQYCQYDNKCINYDVKSFTQCSQAQDIRQCINIDNLSCYYDFNFKQCRKTIKEASNCDSNLSKFACFYVTQATCNWNIQCYNVEARTCEDILNRWGCKSTDNPLYCIWQDNKCISYSIERVPCIDIKPGLNAQACEYSPTDVCQYHTDTLECDADYHYDYLVWTNYPFREYWAREFQKSYIFEDCEFQSTFEFCKKTRKFSCIWQGVSEKCVELQNFHIDCSNLISELACLQSLNKPCAWRYENCIEFTQAQVNYKYSKNTGVNALGCSLFPLQLAFIDNVCQEIDSRDVGCYTKGINKQTCLTSLKEQCLYIKSCQEFVKTTQLKCTDYIDVSILVCQQVRNEVCFHDGISRCLSSTQVDNINLKYLSYYACLIVKQKVYWDNECKLLDFPIQCDQNIKVNYLVCQQIQGLPCIYDEQQQQCVSYYNKNTLSCKQQGINKEACNSITLDACRFDNGCQQVKIFDLPCSSYKNTNRLTCALNQYEICYYDSVNQVCEPSLTKQKCSKLGLNKIGCQFNSLCSWSFDYNQCQCGTEKGICGQDCFSSPNCIQEQFGCRKLICEELSIENCTGQVKNQYCIVFKGKCRGVSSCEDIQNYDKCSQLFVANKNCLQAGRNCISSDNYEQLCPYSGCNNIQCFNDKNFCRLKLCTDLSVKNCSDLSQCQIVNDQCIEVDNCIQSDCQSVNCSYQKYALLKPQQICTTQFCDFYGGSQKLCHGNESNNRACILTSEYLCRSCEQIQDQCECQSALNICYYDQGCKSILCGSFLSQETCLSTKRCQWSLALSSCTVTCIQTVDQDRCNARTNECYFNTLTYICEEGQLQVPDLSPGFDVEVVTYQTLLEIMIYILLN